MVEAPVFVPYTRDSTLRKSLQRLDDTLGECLGSPGVRFVERCGGQTLIELLGSSNPWARAFQCGRVGCLPCKGRVLLAAEESLRPIPEPGHPVIPRPAREDTISIPKCTTEGIGYTLECWPCRLHGQQYRYIGESSRSSHQRGSEHLNEIRQGKRTHPMVQHFLEVHGGVQQEVLFRTIGQFLTALERQVWESVEIDSTTHSLGQRCLNNKTEWGSSKDPALIPREIPRRKPMMRVHNSNQQPGTKRIRVHTGGEEVDVPHRPAKRGRRNERQDEGPSDVINNVTSSEGPSSVISSGGHNNVTSSEGPLHVTSRDSTPVRSRWSRWQEYKRTSPEHQGPNSAIMPTRSGHKGPFIKDLREMLPRSLTQSREGLCVGQPTSVDPGGTTLATTLEGPSQGLNFSKDPPAKPRLGMDQRD